MKQVLFFTIIIFKHCCFFGQGNISGNYMPKSMDTCIYNVNWDVPRSVPVNWKCDGGYIIESSYSSAKIVWNSIPDWVDSRNCILKAIRGNSSGALNPLARIDEVDSAVFGVTIQNYRLQESEFCSGYNGIKGPISISENFGTGMNPGTSLPIGTTTYNYLNNCALTNGNYTIRNSTVGCRTLWLGIPEDHTPNDINGYMLMVDGSQFNNDVYRKTVNGLNTSFKYEFSAWVANLAPPSAVVYNSTLYFQKPRLTFRIEDLNGNILKRGNTIEVDYDPSNPWKQVSFLIEMPPGNTSVQVVLRNENNGALGNDFVVDDISFAPCYSELLASFSPDTLNILDYKESCNSATNNLYGRFAIPFIPYTNPSYQWEKSSKSTPNIWIPIQGANSKNYFGVTETVSDIYYYRLKVFETAFPGTNQYSNIITLYLQKIRVEPTVYNIFNCSNAPFQISPNYFLDNSKPFSTTNNLSFIWSPSLFLNNSNIENPLVSLPSMPLITNPLAPPPVPILYNYTVTVKNNTYTGCSASGTHKIYMINSRPVAIPSGFSPNGDGVNDTFRPINLEDYPNAWFKVWNRWGGNLLFQQTNGTTPASYSWDGKYNGVLQPPGNYVWQIGMPGCPNNILNASMNNNSPSGWVILTR